MRDSIGLARSPRPNLRKEAVHDLFALERQVGGIEPGELIGLRQERARREQVAFVIWWALVGVFVGGSWYAVTVLVRYALGGGE